MTEANKQKYIKLYKKNQARERAARIRAASADAFGFDCVCLLKGLLWGWEGDTSKTYGGAKYASNDVPDIGEDSMINACNDVSMDFTNIQIGEAVWMPGHIGVYIGDGLAVECTPKWEGCVQITAVHNIGKKSGCDGRMWVKHGKLPYVTYCDFSGDGYTREVFLQELRSVLGADGEDLILGTVTIGAKYNNRHACIKPVQRRLAALGYTEVGTADGCAGAMFTSAMLHFQQDRGCTMTGMAEEWGRTWQELIGAE